MNDKPNPSYLSFVLAGLATAFKPGADETRLKARRELIEMMGVPVEEGEIMAGSIRTPYLAAGSGHPLVLLHGMGTGAVQFYNIIGPLAKHFRVIALDQPGFGEADKPKGAYDRDFFAAWLNDALTALNLDDIYLLGHSQGGAVCLGFASRHLSQIKKLVVISAAGLSESGEGARFSLMMLRYILPSEALFADDVAHNYSDPSIIPDAYITYQTGVHRMRGAGHSFWQGRGKVVSPIDAEELKRITVPTLVIWGGQDTWFDVAGANKALGIFPSGEIIVLENSGHDPIKDNPEETLKAVIDFLT